MTSYNNKQGKLPNTGSKPERKVNDKVRFTEKQLSEGLKQASRHHIESFDYAM